MTATRAGGLKARDKNLAKDPDFYKKIGSLGGSKGAKDGTIKGFALDRDRAVRAGAKGGKISKRVARNAYYTN